jgi:hypothetical protein
MIIFPPGQAVEKGPSASLRLIASLQRTEEYASAHRFSRASHLDLFEQPASLVFRYASLFAY